MLSLLFNQAIALLPSQCCICRLWGQERICAACVDTFSSNLPRCLTCALGLPGGAVRCGSCIKHGSALDACYAAVDYDYPWDGLIAQLKFSGRNGGYLSADPAVARLVAGIMQQNTAIMQALTHADWLVPIPLAAARLRERGFNQALQIAQHLIQPAHNLPNLKAQINTQLLVRTLETLSQVGLGRQARQRNMLHAFAVEPAHAARVKGTKVVLIDDVTTTTATLCAAASALRHAGAAQVVGLVFARTPAVKPSKNKPSPALATF